MGYRRQNHAVNAQLMQFADGVARIVTQRILGGRGRQRSRYAAPEPPSARRFPVRYRLRQTLPKPFSRRANQNTFAVNLRFNSGAGQRSLRFRRSGIARSCVRFADSLRQRVRVCLFYGGCRQRQQFSPLMPLLPG